MQLSTREARKVIDKVCDQRTECTHHVRGFVIVDGKRVFPIHCSFGNKDMPVSVIHRFRRSLRVTIDEFSSLVGCTMDRDHYKSLIVNRLS